MRRGQEPLMNTVNMRYKEEELKPGHMHMEK